MTGGGHHPAPGGFVDVYQPDPPATPDARDAERRPSNDYGGSGGRAFDRVRTLLARGAPAQSPAPGGWDGDDEGVTPLPAAPTILGKPTPPAGLSLDSTPWKDHPTEYLFGRKGGRPTARGRGGGGGPAMNATPLPSGADLVNLHRSGEAHGRGVGSWSVPSALSAGRDYVAGLFASTRSSIGCENVNEELNLHQIRGTVSGRGERKLSMEGPSPICDRSGNAERLSRAKIGQVGELSLSYFGPDDRSDTQDGSVYSYGSARPGYLATGLSRYCGSRRRALAVAGLVLTFVVVVAASVGGGKRGAQEVGAAGSSGQGVRGGDGSGPPVVVPEEGEQANDGDADRSFGGTTAIGAIDNSDTLDQPTNNETLDNSESAGKPLGGRTDKTDLDESGQTGVPSVDEDGECNDDPNFKFYTDGAKTDFTNCADYVGGLALLGMQGVLEQRCDLPGDSGRRHQAGNDLLVSHYCRKSCGKCPSGQDQAASSQTEPEGAVGPTQSIDAEAKGGCADDLTFVFFHDSAPADCNTFVANVPKSSLLEDRCGVNFISEDGLMTRLSQYCRKSCHVCT